jgi:hypothetical protein
LSAIGPAFDLLPYQSYHSPLFAGEEGLGPNCDRDVIREI